MADKLPDAAFVGLFRGTSVNVAVDVAIGVSVGRAVIIKIRGASAGSEVNSSVGVIVGVGVSVSVGVMVGVGVISNVGVIVGVTVNVSIGVAVSVSAPAATSSDVLATPGSPGVIVKVSVGVPIALNGTAANRGTGVAVSPACATVSDGAVASGIVTIATGVSVDDSLLNLGALFNDDATETAVCFVAATSVPLPEISVGKASAGGGATASRAASKDGNSVC